MGLRRSLAMMLLIIAIVGAPRVRCSPDLGNVFVSSQDTLRPEISTWGIVGDPTSGAPFLAWAKVTDEGSGVRNVSLVVASDFGNSTYISLLDNGTHYTGEVPGLAANHTYSLYVQAFDLANNSATSYSIEVDTHPGRPSSFDPDLAMPMVVGSSLLLAVTATILSLLYHKRRLRVPS